ncbi:hypothetical protein CR513_17961, partial [Mucuna pruriens]
MDVTIVFLNGDIDEMIYMVQPKSFVSNESKNPSLALNRLPVNGIINSFKSLPHGFKANVVDDCVYHKFNGSKYIFLVLYVDDILLACSDTNLLHETEKNSISKVLDIFGIKDSKLGDTPIVKEDKFSLN